MHQNFDGFEDEFWDEFKWEDHLNEVEKKASSFENLSLQTQKVMCRDGSPFCRKARMKTMPSRLMLKKSC